MYKYETHLHTYPVSRCARKNIEENLKFYKELGYDGIFITNHFLDGNINIEPDKSYEEKINFYFSDYEQALSISPKIGIKVFLGVELTFEGTDFLIYGLDKDWYLSHPEIMTMSKTDELKLMMDNGALVIQAHPFREAGYINHIRLFPRSVHGVEVINAGRTELENKMAAVYAENYSLLQVAGTDNHIGNDQKLLAGVYTDTPINTVDEFIALVKEGKPKIFMESL